MIKTEYYELEYDSRRHQVLWKIDGAWPSSDAVPQFKSDWELFIGDIPGGFMLITDLNGLEPLPKEAFALNHEKQSELINKGCAKIAQVAQSPNTVARINQTAKLSGMGSVLKAFHTYDAAQEWLDQLEEVLM